MSTAYSGDGITFPDNSVQATAPRVGMVNRIINGDMRIDQRNAGASITPTGNTFTVDRWNAITPTLSSKFSIQQNAGSVTPPTGFANYLGLTSLAATTISSADRSAIKQVIEGYNIADFDFGSAVAKTVTLSFWVRSSLTGTFGSALQNGASDRSYPFTYTITTANTWEQKTITVVGDTTGTWAATNTGGMQVYFNVGTGSTYEGSAGSWQAGDFRKPTGALDILATSGATFYITGLQLEKGSTATDFEYVDYGRQLQMCQRYYYRQVNYMGQASPYDNESTGGKGTSTTSALVYRVARPHPVQMRATPSVGYANLNVWDGVVQSSVASVNNNNSSIYVRSIDYNMSGAMGGAGLIASEFVLPSGFIDCSAEL